MVQQKPTDHPAVLIARTLDAHLSGPAEVRVMGGAALVLGYGLERGTEDIDLIMEDDEIQVLIDGAGFSEALEATNRELEPLGLYLSHIWGPEQQILSPRWREQCRRVETLPQLRYLQVTTLGPLDLFLSKLCRADAGDLDDLDWLVETEGLGRTDLRSAMEHAVVPASFRDTWVTSVERVLSRYGLAPVTERMLQPWLSASRGV